MSRRLSSEVTYGIKLSSFSIAAGPGALSLVFGGEHADDDGSRSGSVSGGCGGAALLLSAVLLEMGGEHDRGAECRRAVRPTDELGAASSGRRRLAFSTLGGFPFAPVGFDQAGDVAGKVPIKEPTPLNLVAVDIHINQLATRLDAVSEREHLEFHLSSLCRSLSITRRATARTMHNFRFLEA